ncbi:MAG: flagellar FlbD family protein [Clostridiales bacterium]|nr:flagellar FlbD family protein [Clostridiales bacterium]
MIKLTRINKVEKFWINEHQIEYMEETPDTILTMVSGRKYAVAETAAEITTLILGARRAVLISRDEDGEIII